MAGLYKEVLMFRTTEKQKKYLETRKPDMSKWLRRLIYQEMKKEVNK